MLPFRAPTWADVVSAGAAVGAWLTALYNASKIREVHVIVNSRLSELLEMTKQRFFAAGEKSEKDKHDDKGPPPP